MPSVLIVDDEEAIRKNVERMLLLEGFEVATAPNGQHGLVIARSMLPDIIITDINMPVMDGFDMLAALRELPEFSTTAVIMLTAAEDRANMRKGMRLGADDYLTKPFKREELLEAIATQQQRIARFVSAKEEAVSNAVQAAVSSSEARMREMFTQHYKRDALATTMPPSLFTRPATSRAGLAHTMPQPTNAALSASSPSTRATSSVVASVLFADIRHFTTMAERLSAQELAAMLSHYFDRACQPVLAQGGSHLKLMGDGLMALFEESPIDKSLGSSHARRALNVALALEQVAVDFRAWIRAHVGKRGLPEFAIGIGVHCGVVNLGRLGEGEAAEVTPLGENVDIATRLQAASKELGWTIACSREIVDLAGALVRTGREQVVGIRGRDAPVHACELLAMQRLPATASMPADTLDLQVTLSGSGMGHDKILAAVRENSQQTARAAKDALKDSLWSLQSGTFNAHNPHRFKGYEVVKKLGEGGMSDVFLAHFDASHAKGGQEVVLKVLHTNLQNDPDMMRRFIQEYAILTSIEHHHIARIYDQGFSDDYAYIAMEYLSGGDLKSEIAKRPNHARVVDLLRQIVSALSKIHSLGLVYRDLKPDNLMFRGSGELVLVDFGIVKSIRLDTNALVKTLHGQIVGTPYYVSPEQAASKEVTNRSDFYSLGVMMYELLTGEKPYLADTLDALLARHLYGQVPVLPDSCARFQPLLARLMAKNPDDRPSDCAAIWHNLEALSVASL